MAEITNFSEDLRGNWFSNRSTAYAYIYDNDGSSYYIINEQEGHIIRIVDESQIRVFEYCMCGPRISQDDLLWLISPKGGKFLYYPTVEEYIAEYL